MVPITCMVETNLVAKFMHKIQVFAKQDGWMDRWTYGQWLAARPTLHD